MTGRLFDAPILRVLDQRGRDELAALGRVRSGEAGELVYREGEPADTFFVVLAGEVELATDGSARTAGRVLRSVRLGAVFGEESCELGAQRQARASFKQAGSVFEVPMISYRRAALRCGAEQELQRQERALLRADLNDRLRTLDAGHGQRVLELLLDGGSVIKPARGLKLYEAGAPADCAYLVLEGFVELLSPGARPRVERYLTPGDLFGHTAALEGGSRQSSAVPLGAARLLQLPSSVLRALASSAPTWLTRADRHASSRRRLPLLHDLSEQRRTRVALDDLDRLSEARSLLSIDLDTCVRCGQCASACASSHDGVSRLIRQGAKVASRAAPQGKERSLLLPNSCQHCARPSCLPECPTGAIGRGNDGEVFIREELCTGCGACVRACPWENIQLAPRAGAAPVAAKCDLCSGFEAPACVHACPTESLTRAAPALLFPELRALRSDASATKPPGWERLRPGSRVTALLLVAAAAASLAAALLHADEAPQARLLTGSVAGIFCLALGLQGLVKRLRQRRIQAGVSKAASKSSRVAAWLRGHVVLGLLSPIAVLAHAGIGMGAGGTGSALALCYWGAVTLGLLTAVAYRLLPARLTRLERVVSEGDQATARAAELEDRLHAAVSLGGPISRKLFERLLVPYLRSPVTPWSLLISGRSLAQEESRLQKRVNQALAGRGDREAAQMSAILASVVALAALPARNLLERSLRALAVGHALLGAMFLTLLLVHVAGVLR